MRCLNAGPRPDHSSGFFARADRTPALRLGPYRRGAALRLGPYQRLRGLPEWLQSSRLGVEAGIYSDCAPPPHFLAGRVPGSGKEAAGAFAARTLPPRASPPCAPLAGRAGSRPRSTVVVGSLVCESGVGTFGPPGLFRFPVGLGLLLTREPPVATPGHLRVGECNVPLQALSLLGQLGLPHQVIWGRF